MARGAFLLLAVLALAGCRESTSNPFGSGGYGETQSGAAEEPSEAAVQSVARARQQQARAEAGQSSTNFSNDIPSGRAVSGPSVSARWSAGMSSLSSGMPSQSQR